VKRSRNYLYMRLYRMRQVTCELELRRRRWVELAHGSSAQLRDGWGPAGGCEGGRARMLRQAPDPRFGRTRPDRLRSAPPSSSQTGTLPRSQLAACSQAPETHQYSTIKAYTSPMRMPASRS
jgi:hypothetical protein